MDRQSDRRACGDAYTGSAVPGSIRRHSSSCGNSDRRCPTAETPAEADAIGSRCATYRRWRSVQLEDRLSEVDRQHVRLVTAERSASSGIAEVGGIERVWHPSASPNSLFLRHF